MVQLRLEGLGYIKMALASTNTSSPLDIIQAHFSQVELIEPDEEEDVWIGREKTSDTSEETTTKPKEVSNLAPAELVFPFMSIPLVIAGIPDDLLPLHGPKVYPVITVKHLIVALILLRRLLLVTMCAMII